MKEINDSSIFFSQQEQQQEQEEVQLQEEVQGIVATP